jgi:hypothetical protein
MPAADAVLDLEMIFAGDPLVDACPELSLISTSISFGATMIAARSFSRAARRSCLFLIASIFAKKGCSSSAHPNMQNESETITKFEIMDGAPARGEHLSLSRNRFR